MARLSVQYPGVCAVHLNGEPRGEANTVIRIDPGQYRVELDVEKSDPPFHEITVDPSAGPDEIIALSFRPDLESQFDRLASPLYCRYNGFMLGQFLLGSYANYAREDYPVRRARMQEFLDEIEVDLTVPDWHPIKEAAPDNFDVRLIQALLQTSPEIGRFHVLGAGLTGWSFALAGEERDEEREGMARELIDGVVNEFSLTPPNLELFKPRVLDDGRISANSVLEPALAYVSEIIADIPADGEAQTAFVVMPFSDPFSGYFASFYRPALESAGYRAIRAWGGLSGENYGTLLNRLIEKSGLVWADVSKEREGPNRGQRNLNVLYEIGVAHAFQRRAVIVVDQADVEGLPANIGNDAIHSYDVSDSGFPQTAIEGAVMFIRMHAGSDLSRPEAADLETAVDRACEYLQRLIIPQEARDAQERGLDLYKAGDWEGAEREFSDAIELGNNATGVHMLRAGVRVRLKKYALAEEDLDEAISRDDLDEISGDESPGMRATAHFQRAFARQEQDSEEGAAEDLEEAKRLGFPVEEGLD